MDYSSRLKNLITKFSDFNIDALFITKPSNILYLCGFKSEEATCLITPETKYLITDTRFTQEAEENPATFKVILYADSYLKLIKNILQREKISRLGFEANTLPYKSYLNLRGSFSNSKLIPTFDLIENLRMIKSPEELMLIKKAINFAKKSFKYSENLLNSNLTEKEMALKIEYFIKSNGFIPAFDIIAATGTNSSRPHSKLTNKKIGKQNGLLLDLGICYRGYNCDLTRMLLLSKITAKFKKIYNLVKSAQDIAIESLKTGEFLSKIDTQVRKFFNSNKISKYFVHSLGHGVGLEVHEKPIVSKASKDIALESMVFTIEPGIYIPGWGGIRIEDMVYITKQGPVLLT